jgi:hypothetical protein
MQICVSPLLRRVIQARAGSLITRFVTPFSAEGYNLAFAKLTAIIPSC